jgi:hypothetical protein
METDKHPNDRLLLFLGRMLYVLAIVSLLIGIVCAVGVANFAASLPGLMPMLSAFGPNPLLGMLSQWITSSMTMVSVLLFLTSLVISILLFASGKLIIRSRDLALRVARLEETLAHTPVALSQVQN